MVDDDIEGQEESTVDFDDGIKVTPFNLREEMEEGWEYYSDMYKSIRHGSNMMFWIWSMELLQPKSSKTLVASQFSGSCTVISQCE